MSKRKKRQIVALPDNVDSRKACRWSYCVLCSSALFCTALLPLYTMRRLMEFVWRLNCSPYSICMDPLLSTQLGVWMHPLVVSEILFTNPDHAHSQPHLSLSLAWTRSPSSAENRTEGPLFQVAGSGWCLVCVSNPHHTMLNWA